MNRLIRAMMFVLAAQVGAASVPALTPAAYAAGAASDFTLRDINGQSWSLSALRGKVVVMSFWATWCGPCKEEMPHLQAMYTELKDRGVVILSISSDDARTSSRVKPYILSKGFNFPVLLDIDSGVTGVYNPNKTLPWTVVVDKNLQIAETHAGYNPGDEVHLRETVLKLLAQ